MSRPGFLTSAIVGAATALLSTRVCTSDDTENSASQSATEADEAARLAVEEAQKWEFRDAGDDEYVLFKVYSDEAHR